MAQGFETLGSFGAALVLSPLLFGIINRVKAIVAGRRGRPLLQGYADLAKLLGKGLVLSTTTTWAFRAGPIAAVAGPLAALVLLPGAGAPGLLGFPGDFIALAYVLAFSRLATILAALDTGSSFEGMGASREATFGALSEPVFFLTMIAAAGFSHSFSLYEILSGFPFGSPPETLLTVVALFVLLLTENARIPVDDPNTHLELTMIHEVMVLDHSGPDLACIVYGSGLKLWIYAALVAGLVVPMPIGQPGLALTLNVGSIFAVAVIVGVVESVGARLSLSRVPKLLAGAGACSALALLLSLWR